MNFKPIRTLNQELASFIWDRGQIGMALVSAEGRWLKVNSFVCELLGYSEAELLDKTFQEITHPADVDADSHMVDAVLSGRLGRYVMQKRYIPKQGPPVWVRLVVEGYREGGEFSLFFSQIIPLSEAPTLCDDCPRASGLPMPTRATPGSVQDFVDSFKRNAKIWGAVIAALVALVALIARSV